MANSNLQLLSLICIVLLCQFTSIQSIKISDEVDRLTFCVPRICLGFPSGPCWCCIHDLSSCSTDKQTCIYFCKL
ncbi:hypothetical protein DCAR_0206780 [Daucus carota subsp. sativus]|uniref:Embryo surrounding factor 1 brassicaceae domain-containing protein n=1 Tax=Daucus carota subsp. sativus TaxID=79200 RepID=A0AAF0WF09_DAUCS|nr:hypothetical protein DCAR_0206780 [Daucus carota subsp. sativus]